MIKSEERSVQIVLKAVPGHSGQRECRKGVRAGKGLIPIAREALSRLEGFTSFRL
jgi:hypothetical protein